jgi:hypothetical protein
MEEQGIIADNSSVLLKKTLLRFFITIIFSISLGYFEAAVVVYLREIFYPDGFTFPLAIFSINPVYKRLFLTEIGREAASLVLIFTGACLFGLNRRQKTAYFLTIFAIWDIFYYIWLKVLLASILDWDILFLIPTAWASPVLAPVLCSIVMLLFAMVILYYDSYGKSFKVTYFEYLIFSLAGLIIIISFCIPGPYTAQEDYNSYFNWYLFAAGLLLAIGIFIKCLFKVCKNLSI